MIINRQQEQESKKENSLKNLSYKHQRGLEAADETDTFYSQMNTFKYNSNIFIRFLGMSEGDIISILFIINGVTYCMLICTSVLYRF